MEFKTLEISFIAQSEVTDDMREKIIEDEKLLNGTNTIKDIIKNGKDLMIEYDPLILLKFVYIDMCEKIWPISYLLETHIKNRRYISYQFVLDDGDFYRTRVAIANPKIKIYYNDQNDETIIKLHFIYCIREIGNTFDYTHPHLISDYNGVTKNEIIMHKNDLLMKIKECLQKQLYEHAISTIHTFDNKMTNKDDVHTIIDLQNIVNTRD